MASEAAAHTVRRVLGLAVAVEHDALLRPHHELGGPGLMRCGGMQIHRWSVLLAVQVGICKIWPMPPAQGSVPSLAPIAMVSRPDHPPRLSKACPPFSCAPAGHTPAPGRPAARRCPSPCAAKCDALTGGRKAGSSCQAKSDCHTSTGHLCLQAASTLSPGARRAPQGHALQRLAHPPYVPPQHAAVRRDRHRLCARLGLQPGHVINRVPGKQ